MMGEQWENCTAKNDRLMIDGSTGEEEMSGEADQKKTAKVR